MDSLTQMALGAAVGGAVLGRRIGPRAVLWGAVCGTLPDLDVLISHGDPVRDFTFHRAETHALFYQSLVAPLIAWALERLHRGREARYRHWLLLVWLCLTTHALLDAFTVYGTQLLLPFSDYPVGLGSIFIIDPLYTLPLLIGVLASVVRRAHPRQAAAWNAGGLTLSTAYLLWSVAAQSHVEGRVQRTLAATGADHGRVLVTPTPFNTLLWRIVVMEPAGFREGFASLLDPPGPIEFDHFRSRVDLLARLRDDWTVERLTWFAKGFYVVGLAEAGQETAAHHGTQSVAPLAVASADVRPPTGHRSEVFIADLRMGQVPWFVFVFVVAATDGAAIDVVEPRQLEVGRPAVAALGWLRHRIFDPHAGPPPRS